MPYIKEKDRRLVDIQIEDIFNTLTREDPVNTLTNDRLCGELNYVIFRLAKMLCDPEWKGDRRYGRMNTIVGAIESAKAEFQRRVVNPYEDKKIQENGDVV